MKIEATDIGMANAAEIAALGLAAIERGDGRFDLSAVARCDSSAVAVLLEWQRAARVRGLTLEVNGVPPAIASLAEVYGVGSLLPALSPQA